MMLAAKGVVLALLAASVTAFIAAPASILQQRSCTKFAATRLSMSSSAPQRRDFLAGVLPAVASLPFLSAAFAPAVALAEGDVVNVQFEVSALLMFHYAKS
jgi:hypothetical protein